MDLPEESHEDHYAVLGVPQDAGLPLIRRAWKELAAQYHPDVRAGDPASLETFLRIQQAYQMLSSPQLRSRYDAERRSSSPAVGAEPPLHAAGGFGLDAGLLFPRPQGRVAAIAQRCAGKYIAPCVRYAVRVLPWPLLFRVRTLAGALAAGLILVVLQMQWVDTPWGSAPVDAREANDLGRSQVGGQQEVPPFPSPVSSSAPGGEPGIRSDREPSPGLHSSEGSPRFSSQFGGAADPPGTAVGMDFPSSGSEGDGATARDSEVTNTSLPQPLLAAAQWEDPILLEAPSSSVLRAIPPSPARMPEVEASSGGWNGRWLAGCANSGGNQVWVGVVLLFNGAGHLSWKPWDANPGSAVQTAALRLADAPTSRETSTRGNGDSGFEAGVNGGQAAREISATLTRVPEGFARLSLLLPVRSAVPCTEWNLAAFAPQPVAGAAGKASAAPLTGRWLRPDAESPGSAAPILLETLEVRIEQCEAGLRGRLLSQYRIRRTVPGSGTLNGPRPPWLLQVEFMAPLEEFSGEFPWTSEGYGEGILTLAPISASALALRWQAGHLEPGAIRLSGAVAVLRRR